jgi:uncharacterized coiled-coil protein SlyX
VDSDDLNQLFREIPNMPDSEETDDLLEELQRAADEQQRILARQSELIRRLRAELKDVRR